MIKKTTLNFLNDVGKNNNREWFAEHQEQYLAAKENVDEFAKTVFEELGKTDVLEKLKVYRIYKDVRFVKEKIPYNKYLGGRMIRATKYRRGGYYFHIEPGNTFVVGGFWRPDKDDLLRIRQELTADATDFRKIIEDKKFIQYFGSLNGEQLKTSPKGFDKEHPAIDLLRYKQFMVRHNFTDAEANSPDFVNKATETFQAMRPFLDYMSVVLTTDENGENL
jgi:uncharacterized protein (TIGR02453 family)